MNDFQQRFPFREGQKVTVGVVGNRVEAVIETVGPDGRVTLLIVRHDVWDAMPVVADDIEAAGL